jgi:protein gp37
MENSKIEWTGHTFNPWVGCTKVSPACANCYAEFSEDKRFHRVEWGKGKPRQLASDAMWGEPLKWNEEARLTGQRKKVFCASLADIFDDEIPKERRDRLWKLIKDCPWLDFQLLTKRPENISGMLPPDWGEGWENVWLGTSVENQEWADKRIPLLTDVPAKVHFLSVEPLLGPIQFKTLDDIEWVIVGGETTDTHIWLNGVGASVRAKSNIAEIYSVLIHHHPTRTGRNSGIEGRCVGIRGGIDCPWFDTCTPTGTGTEIGSIGPRPSGT